MLRSLRIVSASGVVGPLAPSAITLKLNNYYFIPFETK
jgi:hypothetical protein